MDGYVNRLRKHALTCEFGTLTDELIRDRLVLGLREESTKLRLLKEQTLSLDNAINMCRSSEIPTQQMKIIQQESKPEDVHIFKQQRPQKPRVTRSHAKPKEPKPQQKSSTYKCYHCGSKDRHRLTDCPAYRKECKSCKKLNHFASVCQSNRNRPRVNAVKEECNRDTDYSYDSDDSIFKIKELSTIKGKGKPLLANLEFTAGCHKQLQNFT